MNNRLLLAAVALAIGGVIAWRLNPPPDNRGGKEAGRPIVEVKVPDLDQTARTGETRFDDNCASCHGKNAAGREGVAPPLVHLIYEPNHHGDASFYLAARQGVRAHHWRFGDMPPVDGVSGDDIRVIISYVRALQRANGIN